LDSSNRHFALNEDQLETAQSNFQDFGKLRGRMIFCVSKCFCKVSVLREKREQNWKQIDFLKINKTKGKNQGVMITKYF